MSQQGAPEGYVEVHERIEAFYEKYPEGSLQSSWQLHEIAGTPTIVVEARAYRGAEDGRPGVGLASEPVPGRTPFTKDSELMNAETSAWGRALASLGFKVKEGIASGNEVRSRQGGESNSAPKPSEKQIAFFADLAGQAGFLGDDLERLKAWAKQHLTGGKGGSLSKAIDGLKEKSTRTETADRLGKAAKAWAEESDDPIAELKAEFDAEEVES